MPRRVAGSNPARGSTLPARRHIRTGDPLCRRGCLCLTLGLQRASVIPPGGVEKILLVEKKKIVCSRKGIRDYQMPPFWRIALGEEGHGHVAPPETLLLVELVYHKSLRVTQCTGLGCHWNLFQLSWNWLHNTYYEVGLNYTRSKIERRKRRGPVASLRRPGSQGSRPVSVRGQHGTDDSYARRVDWVVI